MADAPKRTRSKIRQMLADNIHDPEDWIVVLYERIAALEQEREVLRGTLFRAEGVIEAYAPDSPVLDAIDRALTEGEKCGNS